MPCPATTVRRAITGATQDAHVFRANVRINLIVGRPDADALRAVGVRLLGRIGPVPHGSTMVALAQRRVAHALRCLRK